MGVKDKCRAAARATAARLSAANHSSISDSHLTRSFCTESLALHKTVDTSPIDISSDSDCAYERGVNCFMSDSNGLEFEADESDVESLEELDGDALEVNLCELRGELKHTTAPSKYSHLIELKSAINWKKAEQNCNLGYTGNSKCTQERRAKRHVRGRRLVQQLRLHESLHIKIFAMTNRNMQNKSSDRNDACYVFEV